MKHEFIFNENDENYKLLMEIFDIISSRNSRKIMARNGFKNINDVVIVIKTVFFLSVYFEIDISFAVEQLESHVGSVKLWIFLMLLVLIIFIIGFLV